LDPVNAEEELMSLIWMSDKHVAKHMQIGDFMFY
jgi:hypothetical protein